MALHMVHNSAQTQNWLLLQLSCDTVCLQVDQQHVIIDYKGAKVTCSDSALRLRVEKAMQRLTEAMNPVNIDDGT